MRKCGRCLTFKNEDSFTKDSHRKDGLNPYCRDCTRANSRKGYLNNRESVLKRTSAYRKSEKGKEVQEISHRKYLQKNPKKYIAHLVVNMAIKRGILKAKPCEVCGGVDIQAHHHDYDRPYDVQWLCDKHHKEIHREETGRE